MSSLSVIIDESVGWRNCVKIICGVSWAAVIPMFFVPEPIRNETNRLAAEELAAEEAAKAEADLDNNRENENENGDNKVMNKSQIEMTLTNRGQEDVVP